MTIQNAPEKTIAAQVGSPFIEALCANVLMKDYSIVSASDMSKLLDSSVNSDAWQTFADSWCDLKVDQYMADGGAYRLRRHSTFSALASSCVWVQQPHQPHYQSEHYNVLNGGIERFFEPIRDDIVNNEIFKKIVTYGCEIVGRLSPYFSWHIEAHQFRICAKGAEIAKPTPEGIHRDGVDFVLMVLINRENVTGGQTTLYNKQKQVVEQVTLTEAMSLVVLNDEKTFHGVSPIMQENVTLDGFRDMLVLTFRREYLLEMDEF